MSEFYIVYAPDSVSPPHVKHQYKNVAIEEAKRLARLNPNKEFYVLKAIGRAVKTDVVYRDYSCEEEE